MPEGKKDANACPCDMAPIERLSGRNDIDSIFRNGRRLKGRNLTVLYRPREDERARCAVFVPKRLGGAVRRNRARRVLRESVRQEPHPALRGKDLIILCRKPVTEKYLEGAKKELRVMLDRLPGA